MKMRDYYGYGSSRESEDEESLKSSEKRASRKVHCGYAPGFLLFWVTLFFALVIPLFNRLPEGLTIEDESHNKGAFIAERAQKLLYEYDVIGPKVVGSHENENVTVALLRSEIDSIRQVMLTGMFEMEVDVQQVSGAYMRSSIVNMYQGVQNVVVKLSCKVSTSNSYLLVNSHFDSKPGSPGAGDDGHMMVAMLEVLRQMATTNQTFEHPIVFLFNGAEENSLQGSHGFITQHKWAKQCKALINLDAAGSGGREILFQSGPNHPWLMKYYKKYALHPFATTMAEEIFQAGIIPSDTDFRVFRDYGNVPGLDMAQCTNGYVYHTKYDTYNVIPRGSLQNTGDNLLALVRGFSNASELYNTQEHADGHAVFFDFLGLFFIYHTEEDSSIYNMGLAVIALMLILISLVRISCNSYGSLGYVFFLFIKLFVLQLVGFALGLVLPLAVAYMMDSLDRTLSYFTNTWLAVGLYAIPSMIGLSLPTAMYFSLKSKSRIDQSYQLQLAVHAHCTIIAVLAISLTWLGVRSTYLCGIALLFYVGALAFNLLTSLHDRLFAWKLVLCLSQLLPFVYFCYLFYAFVVVLIPMTGRNGNAANPDLLIAGICALGTILSMGFLMPLLNDFRRPKLILTMLAILTITFAYIGVATQIGFPYRPKTNVQRVNMQQVHRIFYEYDGQINKEEFGYLLDFQNRRMERPLYGSKVNLTGLRTLDEDCSKYMMCGMPFFSRIAQTPSQIRWLQRSPLKMPGDVTLENINKSGSGNGTRFEFRLTGPPHMSLFVQPLEGTAITGWSFIRNPLDNPDKYGPPYYIYFCYGNDSSPLNFHIDVNKTNGDFNVPLFELGVVAHYLSTSYTRDSDAQKFIDDFPDYTFIMDWPSIYKRYIY
ncbi:endoplasmic reticulum metallopeptidase 1-like isoform X2 [Scaptodrosophila lebanonensis]|uniref:FXNA-like protease n=1 Tax=Drosophila lebanonensis TaxID=7225 RepID=A0A6J2TNZ0_DROLE|nr:endoplasmic reticulum metallopeptidase 1-like isoform X2 [Scaptodrosophila lebanonensis]